MAEMEGELRPSPEPTTIAVVSLEHLHGYVPDGYVGLVLATGSSPYDAVEALEQRALGLARQSHALHGPDPEGVTPHVYAVLGLRFAAGISSSGQPDWAAYGTLTRGTRQPY